MRLGTKPLLVQVMACHQCSARPLSAVLFWIRVKLELDTRNKLENTELYIQENAWENAVCKMLAILLRPPWVWCYKTTGPVRKRRRPLYLRIPKLSRMNRLYIFQCMGKILCVEFQRATLKFHTKNLIHQSHDTTGSVPGLFWTKIVRPLTGPVRPRAAPYEFCLPVRGP